MRKIFYLIIIFLFFINGLFSQEENINKYKFEVYYLIKGKMKKNKERPNFGWRILKTFPLSVKEYTFTSQFYDYNSEEIKELSQEIIKKLSASRQKNAIHIADKIYEYISENIKDRQISKEIKATASRVYFSYRQVLKEKQGCDVEKSRLAVTLFRCFTIPARMVYVEDHYAVEYYIMPLKGKGEWFLMDFIDNEQQKKEYSFPVYWHPLDCKELLNEYWDNNCYIDKLDVKNIFLSNDEIDAESKYNDITNSVKSFDEIQTGAIPEKGEFILIKKILYELWLPADRINAKVNILLPFNAVSFFRTKYWYAKSLDKRLEIKMKRIHTEVKPPQEGMLITFPLEFKINYNN